MANIFKRFDFKKKLKRTAKDEFIGKGFSLEDRHEEEPLDIFTKFENRINHTFVFGSTGVGKTRLLELMIEQDIKRGENVVIIDPKGDTDLFAKTIYLAQQAGRVNDLLYLGPLFPEYSISINPLKQYYIKEEVIGHIMSCVDCDDPFFYSVAHETTILIVTTLLLARQKDKSKKPLTLDEIARYTSKDGISNLYETYFSNDRLINKFANELAKTSKTIKEAEYYEKEIAKLRDSYIKVVKAPNGYFEKVSNTLSVTLTKLTSGNLGRLIATEEDNKFISQLENQKGCIFFVQTASMLTKDVSDAIGKIVLSMIIALVGRLNGSNKKFDKRLNIYIDEMSRSLFDGIETLFQQARSAGVCVIGLTQSWADIIKKLGKDSARTIFDNTSTKIIMKMNDLESAETVSKMGGTHKVHTTFLNDAGKITSRETEEDIIKPVDVLNLNKREFYYFGFEGRFKGKTADVSESYLRLKLPEITTKE
ncbi:type IV secretion system DNA-binding domain-containing protein [Campylobacter sp. RM12651]|uniref:type IV secretory system conjugative DNA transfer family protein n=1 Tax=Campylobacter sp. RM12651 TaxID=1660079 RepID=UPI001EFBEE3D|nr:type IV secretion system DNA-binding domain-containing protein [Campylobacter sp. RM12651]ULO03846.1 F-type type IV conjugative transfer system, coupling factor TraD [Campylobacter sp. RM12651]